MAAASLQLTEGDIETFWWVWLLRVLSLDQLRRLRYFQPETARLSSEDNVRKRLARLAQAGYMVSDRLHTTRERLYFLGEKALRPLRAYHGIDQQQLFRPRAGETLTQLLHPLLVSEIAVRLVESLRDTPDVNLMNLLPLELPFLHTHAIGNPRAKKHTERFVTQVDLRDPGNPEPLRIRPDLVFGLEVEESRRLFFVEADRGFEGAPELARKQRAYAAYRDTLDSDDPQHYLWQRYGDFADFRVLVVTTTAKRIESLEKVMKREKGYDLVAFGTAEEVARENVVTGGFWQTGDGRRQSFLRHP